MPATAQAGPAARKLAVNSVGLEMLPADALAGWAATLEYLQLDTNIDEFDAAVAAV